MSRLPDHLSPPAVVRYAQSATLECNACGATADATVHATCNCKAGFKSPMRRATEYAQQHPTASVREVAAQTSVGVATAHEAKARVRGANTHRLTPPSPAATARAIQRQSPGNHHATSPATTSMKTEDLELFLTMFQGFSWNARAMATHGQDKLFDAWDRGEPDKPPKIKPSQIIRLIERLDRSGQGEVLDAIDRIFTRENEEGVER